MHTYRFSPQPGNTVQLSPSGYQFITDLFQKYDKDGDNALSPPEQEVSDLSPPGFTSGHMCSLWAYSNVSMRLSVCVCVSAHRQCFSLPGGY